MLTLEVNENKGRSWNLGKEELIRVFFYHFFIAVKAQSRADRGETSTP